MHGRDESEQGDGEGQLPEEAGDNNGQGLSEIAGSLQERLAAHGRKLADTAGGLEAAASERIGGLVDSAEHFSFGHDGGEAAPVSGERLAFDEPAHLPWLESADEDDDDGAVDMRRVVVFVAAGLALLAAIVGGIWWSTHRGAGDAKVADGSVIAAPAGPYKTAPTQPGGKTYEGTGASSFAVSQGHNPTAHLAGGEAGADAGPDAGAGTVKTPAEAGAVAMAAAKAAGQNATGTGTAAAQPEAHPAAAASHAAAGVGAGGGVGVQVGAYTSQASAEAGWNKLVKQYGPLGEVRHRVVQGQADIGTVYRLQAVPGSESAANALCAALKGQGMACQVKR